MAISWISNAHARSTINDIRKAIGRPITFYVTDLSECTICSVNPITNTSTDPFCSGCNGEYFITTYSGVVITGHITHSNQDMLIWNPNGQTLDGDTRLQIEYTITNLDVIDRAEYLIADGKKFEIKKYIPRGFQELNRIILLCKESEKDEGN